MPTYNIGLSGVPYIYSKKFSELKVLSELKYIMKYYLVLLVIFQKSCVVVLLEFLKFCLYSEFIYYGFIVLHAALLYCS